MAKDLAKAMLAAKKPPAAPPAAPEGSNNEGRMAAASDIIQAIKAGDAKALDLALEDHYVLCQSPSYEE